MAGNDLAVSRRAAYRKSSKLCTMLNSGMDGYRMLSSFFNNMYNTTSKQKSLIELCLDNTKETFIAGNVIRLSHEKCNIKEGTNIKYYLVISSRQSFENNINWVECIEILENGTLGAVIHEFNDTEFKFYISIGTLSVEKYKHIQTLLS